MAKENLRKFFKTSNLKHVSNVILKDRRGFYFKYTCNFKYNLYGYLKHSWGGKFKFTFQNLVPYFSNRN